MTEKHAQALRSDHPIESKDEDRLGRAAFGQAIAAQILESPGLDSYVVALMGPWGSGKTSLLNMVAEEISLRSDKTAVVRFNPWIFSGAEQLVGHFFRELGAQLTELKQGRVSSAGSAIQKYAGLFGKVAGLIPVAGAGLQAAADLTAAAAGAVSESPSIEKQRKRIRDTLSGMDQRIIVLIDDIDRLRREEVRELVKLVRLTGDFPNIVYVLAFDRKRVELALGDDDETGRAYLEKIVQVGFDVPLPLVADVNKLLFEQLNLALEGMEHGYFEPGEWANVFHFVVQPLIRSPRDARRYVNAIRPTVRVVGREVALIDLLALEAIRIFLPDMFSRLPSLSNALTVGYFPSHSAKDLYARALNGLIDMAGERRDVATELLRRIFPPSARYVGNMSYGEHYAKAWRKYRRVAWADVFRFYFERRLPEGAVATAQVESIVQLLDDRSALQATLEKLDSTHFEDLLGRLEAYEHEFPVVAVESATAALLDQGNRLRTGRSHLFDLGGDMALHRVILRLLRRIDEQNERERVVSSLLPTLNQISAMRAVVEIMKGHELASPSMISQWRADISSLLIATDPEKLKCERSLGLLLVEAFEAGDALADAALQLLSDAQVFLHALISLTSVASSMAMGDVTSTQQLRLPWEALELKFGSDRVNAWFGNVLAAFDRADLDTHHRAVLELAKQYRGGWRPNDGFQTTSQKAEAPTSNDVQDDTDDQKEGKDA